VPTCGGKLEGTPRTFLTPDVGKVRYGRSLGFFRRFDRRRLQLAAEVRDGFGEMADGYRVDAREGGLGGGCRRTEDPVEPGPARTLRDREGPADRTDSPVESELTYRGVLGEPLARQLAGSREDRECDREVEARSLLA